MRLNKTIVILLGPNAISLKPVEDVLNNGEGWRIDHTVVVPPANTRASYRTVTVYGQIIYHVSRPL